MTGKYIKKTLIVMRVFFNFAIVNPNELFFIGFYFGIIYFLHIYRKKKPDKIITILGGQL